MSYFDPASPQNKPIINFFKDKTLLIVDSKELNRTTIKKIMIAMGFNSSNVKTVNDIFKAQEILYETKPHFIVANLEMGQFTGLDLLEIHLALRPDRNEAGFFIISDDNSLSNASIILNYFIDGFIPIPFTIKGFQGALLRAVNLKINLDPYREQIEKSRTKFYQEDIKGALEHAKKAQKLNEKPAMALFIESAANFYEGNLDEAENLAQKSIEVNPNFYRGLNFIYKIYEVKQKNDQAYEVAKKMATLFPINYERIPNLTRLCILTKHYGDILSFYEIIKGAGIESGRVKVYVAAGLVIYGKILFAEGEKAVAVNTLKKAAHLSPSKVEILNLVIKTLLEQDEVETASEILDYAKKNKVNDLYYEIFNFKILAKKEGTDKILQWGKKLVMSEFKALEIYLDLITAIKGKEEFQKDLDQIITQAKKDYPLNKDEIDQAAA